MSINNNRKRKVDEILQDENTDNDEFDEILLRPSSTNNKSFLKSDRSQQSFIKHSQNIDIGATFNSDEEYNDIIHDEMLQIVISKNNKIRKRLDQLLKYIIEGLDKNDQCKELLLIAKSDGVQKMITIVEILKQKIFNNDRDTIRFTDLGINGMKKDKNDKNDKLANIEEYDKVWIKDRENDKIEVNYQQFNFLDFTLVEKKVDLKLKSRSSLKSKKHKNKSTISTDVYDKAIIEDNLKVDKLIKIPVMYVYFNFHKCDQLPVKFVQKYKKLIDSGWSIQES